MPSPRLAALAAVLLLALLPRVPVTGATLTRRPSSARDLFLETVISTVSHQASETPEAPGFHDYCRVASVPGWQEGPHHELLCAELEAWLVAAAAGRGYDLMIFAPPRTGKSHTASVLLPSYGLGRFPSLQLILASYAASLANEKSAEARDTLMRVGEATFGVTVSRESKAKSRWGLTGHRGRMRAAGVRVGITGQGGNALICDDPIKDDREARSREIRDAIWQWWLSTFTQRAEPGAGKLLMMTRWNEDDLAGRILREQPEGWKVIELPSRSHGPAEDPLHRPKDTPLWPARFGDAELTKTQRTLGTYWWNALHQQRPTSEQGTNFRRSTFRYFDRVGTGEGERFRLAIPKGNTVDGGVLEIDVPVGECWHFMANDPAFTEDEANDWWALGHWYVTPQLPALGDAKALLCERVWHERMETPDQVPRLARLWAEAHSAVVGIEHKHAGLAVFQQAKRAQRFPVMSLKADRDKQARALPVIGLYDAGQVFHRRGALWLADYEAELLAFPHAGHDDQVDITSYAGLIFFNPTAASARLPWFPGRRPAAPAAATKRARVVRIRG